MTATLELTAGRVSPRDLKVPLALAAAARAKDVILTADCSVVFMTDVLRARVPFAARPWGGGQDCRVNRAQFARVVRACKGADLLLEPTADGLVVSSGALTVTLSYVEGAEVSRLEGEEILSIEGRVLARGLLRAEPFAGRDQSRPVLCGVALDLVDGKAVATDSYRLTVVDVPGLGRGEDAPTLIVPVGAIRPLCQVLASHAGDVTLSLATDGERYLVVVVGDQRWTIRLTGGAYPKYQELIARKDAGDTTEFEVDAGELADVASLIADAYAIGGPRNGALVMSVTRGKVTVRTQETRYQGSVKVRQELAATGDVREPVELGLSPVFLHDAMSAVAPDRACLAIQSPLRPFMATTADALFLLMPIRLHV